ncbi:MAG: hypothetical protein MRJ67_05830 [Nitrospirales bacterium]|nr:hypothetical protein [Nitrospirales bacterium]
MAVITNITIGRNFIDDYFVDPGNADLQCAHAKSVWGGAKSDQSKSRQRTVNAQRDGEPVHFYMESMLCRP